MGNPLSASSHAARQPQAERLKERKSAVPMPVTVCGVDLVINRGVYGTSVDTELMIETVWLNPEDTFLEIGCGSGAVTCLLARTCRKGLATDINPLAMQNAKENAERLRLMNVDFIVGDGFADIQEKFNVLICNPPYNNYPVQDVIDRMFWDPEDELKKAFFRHAADHLLPNGRIYFGWANFQDIDVELPMRLANDHSLTLVNTTEKISRSGRYKNFVLEFKA